MGKTMDFVHESVYPNIDAAEAGLLDAYKPHPNRSGILYYTLACPECDKRRAYYYPGSSTVQCNRIKNCSSTPLWSAIQKSAGLSNKDLLHTIADLANVQLPGKENERPPSPVRALTQTIRDVTRSFLERSEQARNYLLQERGFSEAELKSLALGFYPSHKAVEAALKKAGADLALARSWKLIPDPEEEERQKARFDNRIVGFWEQPDGSIRLWGRRIMEGPGPKYFFSPGLDKTRPYGWKGGSARQPIFIEGNLDQLSLLLLGFNAHAIGGAGINAAQAQFLARERVTDAIHFTDDDNAGRKGALHSIRNCEPLGITVLIASTPSGFGDPDDLRRQGRVQDIQNLLNQAITGGEFLAITTLEALAKKGASQGLIMRDAMRMRAQLTPASAVAFDSTFRAYGAEPIDPKSGALRLAASLFENQLPSHEIERRLQDTYGVQVTIAPISATEPKEG